MCVFLYIRSPIFILNGPLLSSDSITYIGYILYFGNTSKLTNRFQMFRLFRVIVISLTHTASSLFIIIEKNILIHNYYVVVYK